MPRNITVYHNPRCSKSRATVEWLGQQGFDFEVVEYLKTPLDKASLRTLLDRLDMTAGELMRRGEKRYKELELNKGQRSEDELIDAIVDNPILLERPIVATDTQAAIGRPLDNVIELFDDE